MQLYYSYPELQPWLDRYKKDGVFDEKLYLADIKTQLKKLYPPFNPELKPIVKDYIINVKYKRSVLRKP